MNGKLCTNAKKNKGKASLKGKLARNVASLLNDQSISVMDQSEANPDSSTLCHSIINPADLSGHWSRIQHIPLKSTTIWLGPIRHTAKKFFCYKLPKM